MAGLGRKVWAADEILTADNLQDYIQDQVVFVFDSAGARTSGILSPTEGMMSYLKDTNQISVFNGSAWVDIAPDVGTPGTYTKVTTDFKGRVTSGGTAVIADIPLLQATLTQLDTDVDGLQAQIISLPASNVTSGTFAAARIPNLDASKITSGTITRPVNVSGSIFCTDFNASSSVTATASLFGPGTYNQTNTGRAVFIASNGLFGIGASSERFKENIVDADIDTASVLDIRVRKFNYKKSFDENQPEDIGVIAEELEALGLTDFIYYDADGVPDGVAYEKLALALIPVLKMQQSQIDSVVDRLNKLEK